MKRPEEATVTIEYIEDDGLPVKLVYTQNELESAHTILSLMIGEITEEDLKP